MNLFIGSASRNDIPNKYKQDCQEYLDALFAQDYNLVYGACDSGIMGLCYKNAKKNNRTIIGICPEIYKDNFEQVECDEEIITHNISRRTDALISKSDGIIFLPGGIGTIYELFSVLESKRSGEFNKPVIIYNSCGFYDKLLDFIDNIYKEKFASNDTVQNYHISTNINYTISYLTKYHQK